MSQYTITRSCGCTDTVQIRGPRRDRTGIAAKLAENPCRDCLAAQYKRQNAEAANIAASNNWPAPKGSPKQIAWAESIRLELITALPDDITHLTRRKVAPDLVQRLVDLFTRVMLRQCDASWWINNRDYIIEAAREKFVDADKAEFREIKAAATATAA